MREAIKLSKNYITGENVEQIVFKNGEMLKGRARIEILGENGEIKHEIESENIIHNSSYSGEWYRYLYNQLEYAGDNYFSDSATYGTATKPSAFNKIYLSTDDNEESETNIVHKGKVVGWAGRSDTNTGSSKYKGAYNPSESFSEFKDGYRHYHLVYDFGTATANGTFNSVWWSRGAHKSLDGENSLVPFSIQEVCPVKGLKTTFHTGIKRGVDGKYYHNNGGKMYEITNFRAYLNGVEDLKTKVNHNDSYIAGDYAIADNEYIKIVRNTYDKGNNWKASFDIEYYKDGELVKTHSFPRIEDYFPKIAEYMNAGNNTYYDRFVRLAHFGAVRPNGDVILGFNINVGSSYKTLPTYSGGKINFDTKTYLVDFVAGVFNVISGEWVIPPNLECVVSRKYTNNDYHMFTNTFAKFVIDGDTYLASGDSLYRLMDNLETVRYTDKELGANIQTFYGFGCYCPEYRLLLGQYGSVSPSGTTSTFMHKNFIMPHSAHTKLPTPVTKTNADTMKVQYDYYIQLPQYFTEDGDHITYPTVE